MSLRKTSCMACASAKRRCDRGVPACNRCTQKGLPCSYPYQSSWQSVPVAGPSPNGFTWPNIPFLGPLDSLQTIFEQETVQAAGHLNSGFTCIDDPMTWNWDHLSPQAAIDLPVSEQLFTPEANMSNGPPEPRFNEVNNNQNLRLDPSSRPGEPPRHRRKASFRLYRQDVQRPQSVPGFDTILQQTHDIWPRGRDTKTWQFCARELISFVNTFATTATNSFILQPVASGSDSTNAELPLSLQRALSVCATSCTLAGSNRGILDQILETEMQNMLTGSGFLNASGYDATLAAFRQDLAQLQAMVLYQIITLFSTSARQQCLAMEHVPLVASQSRELLLRIQVLELERKNTLSSPFLPLESLSPSVTDLGAYATDRPIRELPESSAPLPLHDKPLHKSEIDSAYRTILISYLARSVHSALTSQTCTLLAELGSLPVFIHSNELDTGISYNESQQAFWSGLRQSGEAQGLNGQNETISYNEFVDRWSQQKELLWLNERDRFVVLLLAACKGVDIVNGQA
ncbi:hypothetical protein FMEXI_1922 [Fusarium mexicanum]|uniref:Zn(2)-C6 fungal-type domain-containing protein n=1 Tax=Fusarium mexicanum TaxID=751941 RepID=A0A8H5JFZ2_9HYPO|nr:hypothetical protein FMEXI_1922 [Fusarium mexicanum]